MYPCKHQFYYIKVGCKGVFVTRTCFRDVIFNLPDNETDRHIKSLVVRAFCICEKKKNKDADQLRGDIEADRRLCFHCTDSTISLLHKSEISSLWASSVAVQSGLCGTWSETPKTGFLTTRLIIVRHILILSIAYSNPLSGPTEIEISFIRKKENKLLLNN